MGRQARHELEELRGTYDRLRVVIASTKRDEAAHGHRRNFDDGPGGNTPQYFRDRPPPQRRSSHDGYKSGGFVA